MGPRRTPTPKEVDASDVISNAARNARQKAMFLCEVNRIRRDEVKAAVEKGKKIVATSKKLCAPEEEAG